MADLPDETLIITLDLLRQLLKLINEVTKTELTIFERFGETNATMSTLAQIQNSRERLNTSYSRLVNLLLRVSESQPNAPSATINLLYQSIEQAQANADAVKATNQETKRDWNLL